MVHKTQNIIIIIRPFTEKSLLPLAVISSEDIPFLLGKTHWLHSEVKSQFRKKLYVSLNSEKNCMFTPHIYTQTDIDRW